MHTSVCIVYMYIFLQQTEASKYISSRWKYDGSTIFNIKNGLTVASYLPAGTLLRFSAHTRGVSKWRSRAGEKESAWESEPEREREREREKERARARAQARDSAHARKKGRREGGRGRRMRARKREIASLRLQERSRESGWERVGESLWERVSGCKSVGQRVWGEKVWGSQCGCESVDKRLWVREWWWESGGERVWVRECWRESVYGTEHHT